MKKTLLSVVAIAALVNVSLATDATPWFNGGLNGASLSGGKWTSPLPDGVTSESNKYALEDVTAFDFTADESKSASASANMDFSTTVTFQYAYDELPAIAAGDKAGIIAYGDTPKYYVLAKDGTADPATNKWVDSEIAATLNAAVAVNVVISNGENSAVFAWYKIGDNAAFAKEIVASTASFQVVDYSGCGEISSLVGQLVALGIVVPGYQPIPQSVADDWAKEQGIDPAVAKELLKNTTVKIKGRTFADSCIMNVGTNESINTAIVDDASVGTLGFTVNCTPVEGRVKYMLKKDGVASGAWQSSKTFSHDLAAGNYTIWAKVDDQEGDGFTVSEKTIGVKAGGTASGFFAVPYTGLADDIAVADLFKKSQLVNGDQIDVFDSATKGWKTFQFNGTAWTGVEKGDVTPVPTTTLLKRGQSFKFTRKGDTTPYYLGYVVSGSPVLAMPSKQYELVANADGSAFDLATKIVSKNFWAAKIEPGSALPAAMYKKVGDTWKVITYDAKGKPTSADASEISGGFFLMNRGDSAQNVTF